MQLRDKGEYKLNRSSILRNQVMFDKLIKKLYENLKNNWKLKNQLVTKS